MKPYDAISSHLNHFVLAEDRVLVRRWLLEFLVANPRYPVTATAQIGDQLIGRWGTDVLRESLGETWSTNPLPATREEWEVDGHRVPDDARPIVLHTIDGCRLELHLLFDVELVDPDLVGTIDHTAVADPAPPHELAPTLAEFAPHLGQRERAALSYLWRVGAVLEWAEGTGHPSAGWIESVTEGHVCRPLPEIRGDEACHRILLSPDLTGPQVLHEALSLVAKLVGALIQGQREGSARPSTLAEQIPAAEVAVVSHVVGMRLALGAPRDIADLELSDEIDWSRALETAQVMEDLLQGLPNPAFPAVGTAGQTPAAPPVLVQDPFRELGHQLADHASEWDRELLERWMVDFVAYNGRFPVPTALALGWGLYRRWGSRIAGDPYRSSWIGTVELRSVEEWQVRGRVPRPDAVAMIVPSGQGRAVHYLLRDDVLVTDRLAALESDAEPDPENLALFRPGPSEAPLLTEFEGLIPRREVEMLRNLWRERIVPHLLTAEGEDSGVPELHGQAHHRIDVSPAEGQSPTVAVIDELAAWFLSHDLEDEIDERVLQWEVALVSHVAAHRLGVEYEPSPLVEQAFNRGPEYVSLLRWAPVFRAAATVEHTLNGFGG